MSDMSHSLVSIDPKDWGKLLELYAHTRSAPNGYNIINSLIQWLAREPDLDVKCFGPDKDWRKDGTFIMIVNNGSETRDVYFNTLNDNLDRLTKVLLNFSTKAEGIKLFGYTERLVPAVDIYRKNFPKVNIKENRTALYTVSREIVEQFVIDPPAGIKLESLKIEDATLINDKWPHSFEGSVNFVKQLIRHNVSVGAYDSDGKLIAWCLRYALGTLGLLQVLESHKRFGLGSLLVRYLSKRIVELGDEVLTPVVTENIPSRRMFEKLGFYQIDYAYWTSVEK